MKADTAGAREAKLRRENARKARKAADQLFPGEKWIHVENGIYLSPRRAIGKKSNYRDELRDAQILRDLGGTVYLAPEVRSDPNKKFDAIVNGLMTCPPAAPSGKNRITGTNCGTPKSCGIWGVRFI